MARTVSTSAASSGPAGAGSILPGSAAKRAMRSAWSCGSPTRRAVAAPPTLTLHSGAGRADARSAKALPAGAGGSRLQKQRVDRHPCRHQQETQQRNPSLPWGHYPYSCAYPAPEALFEGVRKRSVNCNCVPMTSLPLRAGRAPCGIAGFQGPGAVATGGHAYNSTQLFTASHGHFLQHREVCLLVVMGWRQRYPGAVASGRRSMFLIRTAFWVGLAVLLLPTDERQQARLYGTAVATVERVTTFCDRNAQACAAGAELWATFVKKAEFGARMAIDLVSSGGRKDEDAAARTQPASAQQVPRPKRGHARGEGARIGPRHADARRLGSRLARPGAAHGPEVRISPE